MKEKKIRKNLRIKGYDYSLEGYYFITICTKDRECILSKISKCRGEHCSSELTKEGITVKQYIEKMKSIYKNIEIDEYIIMPNHIHMILIINKRGNNSISQIIQQLKGIITKKLGYSIWQKLFYEHIIRNDKEYLMIKKYIIDNPYNWNKDKYF